LAAFFLADFLVGFFLAVPRADVPGAAGRFCPVPVVAVFLRGPLFRAGVFFADLRAVLFRPDVRAACLTALRLRFAFLF
jgi:hypothetical protein